MAGFKSRTAKPMYVDTPRGIFTDAGTWFRTTEPLLETYAGPVLAQAGLPTLLRRAEAWLRSAETVVLWALPAFLLVLPPLPAALAALVLYLGWRSLSPAFTTLAGAVLVRPFGNAAAQLVYYVLVLSWLATGGAIAATVVGLVGFVLLRWGLVARATQPFVAPLWRSLYRLPVPDQVLRTLIVRAALKHGVSLPELDRLERQIIDTFQRRA